MHYHLFIHGKSFADCVYALVAQNKLCNFKLFLKCQFLKPFQIWHCYYLAVHVIINASGTYSGWFESSWRCDI